MKIELSNSQIKELIERNIIDSNQLKDIVLNLLTESNDIKEISERTIKTTENITEKPVKRYRKYTDEFIAGIQKRVDSGEKLYKICQNEKLYYNGIKPKIIKKKV